MQRFLDFLLLTTMGHTGRKLALYLLSFCRTAHFSSVCILHTATSSIVASGMCVCGVCVCVCVCVCIGKVVSTGND